MRRRGRLQSSIELNADSGGNSLHVPFLLHSFKKCYLCAIVVAKFIKQLLVFFSGFACCLCVNEHAPSTTKPGRDAVQNNNNNYQRRTVEHRYKITCSQVQL